MSLTAITSFQSGEVKIFHELDVHHFEKVAIKICLTEDAEMSLKAISFFGSAK